MTRHLNKAILFVIFWIVIFCLYAPTAGAGFVFDHIAWIQNYIDKGWKGILTAFDDKSLHYGYHIAGFLAWKIFGLNGTGWMLLFVTLHALNSTLSYIVFRKLFNSIDTKFPSVAAFLGSLLFAVSPYHTEPVVWYACIHYLVSTSLLLISLLCIFQYLNGRNKNYVFFYHIIFLSALFTLEISFAFPVILCLFLLFWPSRIFCGIHRFHLLKVFALPSFVLLLFYFTASHFLRGSIVGHYGAEAHLNFSIPLLAANLSKYVSKIFCLSQFYPYGQRHELFSFFENSLYGWVTFSCLSVAALLFLLFRNKLSNYMQGTLLLLGFFLVALLPTLNLFVTYIVNIEGDRFIYFPAIFAYQLLAFAVMGLTPYIGSLFLVGFLCVNIKFQQHNIDSWVSARDINQKLVRSFNWWNASRVYLLNSPDNFRGVYMFRSFPPDNSFAETLHLENTRNFRVNIFNTYQYNMIDTSDCVSVEKISENELKVTFSQWGNWWWHKGIGAEPVSNELFDLSVADEWGHSYRVIFHKKMPGTVYLYQCAGEWKEVEGF